MEQDKTQDAKEWKQDCEKEFVNIFRVYHNITDSMVEIKTSIHKLEQLGIDVKEYEKIIDNIGIYLHKLDNHNLDKSIEIDEIEEDL